MGLQIKKHDSHEHNTHDALSRIHVHPQHTPATREAWYLAPHCDSREDQDLPPHIHSNSKTRWWPGCRLAFASILRWKNQAHVKIWPRESQACTSAQSPILQNSLDLRLELTQKQLTRCYHVQPAPTGSKVGLYDPLAGTIPLLGLQQHGFGTGWGQIWFFFCRDGSSARRRIFVMFWLCDSYVNIYVQAKWCSAHVFCGHEHTNTLSHKHTHWHRGTLFQAPTHVHESQSSDIWHIEHAPVSMNTHKHTSTHTQAHTQKHTHKRHVRQWQKKQNT